MPHASRKNIVKYLRLILDVNGSQKWKGEWNGVPWWRKTNLSILISRSIDFLLFSRGGFWCPQSASTQQGGPQIQVINGRYIVTTPINGGLRTGQLKFFFAYKKRSYILHPTYNWIPGVHSESFWLFRHHLLNPRCWIHALDLRRRSPWKNRAATGWIFPCGLCFFENLAGQIKRSLTPPKFNMEPEKKSLEKEVPLGKAIIFRFHVKFRGSTKLVTF